MAPELHSTPHRGHTPRAATALAALVLLAGLAAPAAAQQQPWTGLRAMGMADAFVGGGSGTSAIYHNPAGISLAPIYSAELGYLHNIGPNLHTLGVGIADGATNPNFGGAIAYNLTIGDGRFGDDGLEGTRDHDLRAALTVPIVPQRITFGFGTRYVNFSRGTREELAANQFRAYGFGFDLGLIAAVIPEFAVGVSFLNLGAPEDANLPRTLRAGTALFLGPLHLELDYGADFDSADDTTSTFAVGTEISIANTVPVRAGFRHEGLTDRNVLTGGIGYRTPEGGIDAAIVANPSTPRDIAFAFSLLGYF
ncbi:MAG: hypothetical protein EA398_13330 [Deltaproteobacteria bacterium]|nr:MAG: hypothetical protein EA398_13330 [Deltaproteobacteria bacterium]